MLPLRRRGAVGGGQHENSTLRPWRITGKGGKAEEFAQNVQLRWMSQNDSMQMARLGHWLTRVEGRCILQNTGGHGVAAGWPVTCLGASPGKGVGWSREGQAAPADGEHINLSTAAGSSQGSKMQS